MPPCPFWEGDEKFFKVAGELCSYRSYDTWSLIRKICYSHWKNLLLSVSCISGCKSLLSLSQCFSNLSVHQNQLGGGALLKHRLLPSLPEFMGQPRIWCWCCWSGDHTETLPIKLPTWPFSIDPPGGSREHHSPHTGQSWSPQAGAVRGCFPEPSMQALATE